MKPHPPGLRYGSSEGSLSGALLFGNDPKANVEDGVSALGGGGLPSSENSPWAMGVLGCERQCEIRLHG